MPIKVNNIRVPIDTECDLKEETAKILQIKGGEIADFKIIKQSVDARRKNNLQFVYSVCVSINGNESALASGMNDKDVQYIEPATEIIIQKGNKEADAPPVVAGFGPAGIFAAYLLAKHGYNPVVLERGGDVESRCKAVNNFWDNGILDCNNNVQFGEGGAGTFSDGKLTTRINDPRCSEILKLFVKFGAPQEILWQAKPHIGTDILRTVVKNIRNEIIRMGGSIQFFSKLEDIEFDGSIKRIKVNNEWQKCSTLILAVGHSARETFEMLYQKGVLLSAKSFAVGVRIEHSQKQLDTAQYGDYAGHPKLKHSDYQLAYKGNAHNAYSFCMCPGGTVIAASSEEGGVVTNGMSRYKRDGENANSAIVVDVHEADFGTASPLDGMYFQRALEQKAFVAGGSNYNAPFQTVGDFLNGTPPQNYIAPSYKPGASNVNQRDILPSFITNTLAEGLMFFNRKIRGFANPWAVMTGVETRTSSPIRILRGEDFQSVNVKGLYPAGEGAGYAGGIMSAAVDGMKTAQKLIEEYKPI